MDAESTERPAQVSGDDQLAVSGDQVKSPPKTSQGLRSSPAGGPDGAYSWFIAALCFLVSLLFSAFFRCGAIFFTYIMAEFGTTRAQASIPLSVYNGFVNLSGLVAGPLIHRFGTRSCAVLGGVFISLGLMASAFATGIGYLVGSIGVVTGSGHGLLLTCVIVAVNEYFDKKRGTALGINMTGATAATLVFPMIWDYCLDEYGLRASLGLVGVLLLNIPIISVLFRKPPWLKMAGPKMSSRSTTDAKGDKQQQPTNTSLLSKIKAMCSSRQRNGKSQTFISKSRRFAASIMSLKKASAVTITRASEPSAQSVPSHVSTASARNGRRGSKNGIVLLNVADLLKYERNMRSSHLPNENHAVQYLGDANLAAVDRRLTNSHKALGKKDLQTMFPRLQNGSDHDPGGGADFEISKNGIVGQKFLDLNSRDSSSHRHDNVTTEICANVTVPGSSNSEDFFDDSSSGEKDMSGLERAKKVLSMPRFYAHALSYASYTFFLDTFLAIAVDCAVDAGIERNRASHVLTMFSVTDAAGRLLMPLLADYGLVSPLCLLTASYLLIASIGLAMPHALTHLLFWTFVVSLGLPVGYVMVAFSQTLSTEVGLRNLPIAYGFLAGATAVGVFLMPLVIGFYRDSKGSYDGLFRLMGAMVFTSFLLNAWLWFTSARKERAAKDSVDTASKVC